MQSASVPLRMAVQWAGGAVAPYVHTVPVPTQIGITPGAASFTDGFPPLNFQPVASGGVPPFGNDVNGILNITTAWLQWLQAGGPVAYNAGFSAAITGYPKGALVASSTTFGVYWISSTENNVTNPDAGGAGWTPWQPNATPTRTTLTSGSGNYNPQANAVAGFTCKRLRVRMNGTAGNGGQPGVTGSNGAAVSFGTMVAAPGNGGGQGLGGGGAPGAGGLTSGNGANGASPGSNILRVASRAGAPGHAVAASDVSAGAGGPPSVNGPFGNMGGYGAQGGVPAASGNGGGSAGEYVEFDVFNPGATLIPYVIGALGANGNAGSLGIISIEEQYQ